jgi:hypothetical protein
MIQSNVSLVMRGRRRLPMMQRRSIILSPCRYDQIADYPIRQGQMRCFRGVLH